MANNSQLYSDINSHYDPGTPSNLICTGAQALLNSIVNLINTIKDIDGISERPFKPYLGSELYLLLFDPIDDITSFKINMCLFNIVKQEPRATLVMGQTSVTPNIDQQGYDITLTIVDNTTNEVASSTLILSKP